MAKAKPSVSSKRTIRTTKDGLQGREHSEKAEVSVASHEGNAELVMDRRSAKDRRGSGERRVKSAPVAQERRKLERREKVNRRRQIDPTTCERDYSPEEIEFMGAMDLYKRTNGRMFPTCSEILEVIRSLGYEKRAVSDPSPDQAPVPIGSPTSPLLEAPVLIPTN